MKNKRNHKYLNVSNAFSKEGGMFALIIKMNLIIFRIQTYNKYAFRETHVVI